MQVKINLLSDLLREMEAEIGTRDLANLVLEALNDGVTVFQAKNVVDFCEQFEELVKVFSATEPKFGILNYHFGNLLKKFKEKVCNEDCGEKEWKSIVLQSIEDISKH